MHRSCRMEQGRIITRKNSAELEEKLSTLAKFCQENGTSQELLVALAATIQQQLICRPNSTTIPHAAGVEIIMRAVEHTLRGDPEMNGYILTKLNYGTSCLNNWMAAKQKPLVMA